MRIIKKLEPEWFEKLVSESIQARLEAKPNEQVTAVIKMKKSIFEILMKQKFKSSKKLLFILIVLTFVLVKSGKARKFLRLAIEG